LRGCYFEWFAVVGKEEIVEWEEKMATISPEAGNCRREFFNFDERLASRRAPSLMVVCLPAGGNRAAMRSMVFKNHRVRFAAVLAVVLLSLPGCTLLNVPARLWPFGKKKPPRATLKVDQLMGSISMVNEDASFVLIDSGTLPSPAVGTILKTHTTEATPVELRVTQVRKPPFYVADIVKGMPKKGEQVFQ
jgi:hypothetical protein